MVALNIDLDYTVDVDDRKNPSFKTNPFISISVLRSAINAKSAKEGIKNRDAVRVASRVINKITTARNKEAPSIDFDLWELLHVRDTMRAWMSEQGVPEAFAGWYELLMTEIERGVEDGEALAAARKNTADATKA